MPDRGLPDYTTGTITATNGSRSVTGSGTGWTTTINGVTEVTIGKGDMLIVSTGRPVMVESVESATALTLTEAWPNSTATGTAYKIRRYVALPTGSVLQAVQALEAKGSDTNALTSWTIDGGTTRLKLRQAAGGQASLAVGTTGVADGSLLDAILISSAGNVGIGAAPGYLLDVAKTSAGADVRARVRNISSANTSSATLSLETGLSNTSLNIAIANGSGSPTAYIQSGSAVGGAYLDLGAAIFRNTAGTQNHFSIGAGTSAAYGATDCIIQANAASGYAAMQAIASSGNSSHMFFKTGSSETVRITAGPGNDLILSNGSGATERARLSSGGILLIGGTTANPIGDRVNAWSIDPAGQTIVRAGTGMALGLSTTSGAILSFYSDNGSAAVAAGSVSISGSTATYNTSSDRRLKTDISPLMGALDRVMALPARAFRWRSDAAGPLVDGFIADEAAKAVPLAVSGAPGAEDDDGKPVYQQIDHSKMVPVLWAAVQELAAQVAQYSNRIRNLEVAT
jgi:hypothetical protein